ncbi:LOW QUALITY PROTEIN: calcium-binding and coiled-coil domain-containing protein 2 [Corvus cornix cornix]|uniref:LOW QUALITY PROTEIN: calcium-binding and coiled-coil domain-containing protein 2 n=1 Tax=Corvus cornix cornix TaxID=932674 RepID=UPI00194E0388|nr:LOW QUALITY PROTEIN: calcium-binding and coiled-coil domain-containing protein 2 [Corvus cornix cornix]
MSRCLSPNYESQQRRARPGVGPGRASRAGAGGGSAYSRSSVAPAAPEPPGRPSNSSMEDSPEEPPSSCVLLERCHFSQVLFTNVEKFYVPGTDVTCHYSLSPGIVPRGKDWVGIFQSSLRFSQGSTGLKQGGKEGFWGGIFGGFCSPGAEQDLLFGAPSGSQELQEALESLRSSTERLELELNSLKSENRALKEQGGCREAELQRLKEQIQGVNSDKERLEGRLRAALEHLDQLQSKVSDYEKEVENLSRAEQDKTKQLQSLKGENQELLQTSAQHQDLFPRPFFPQNQPRDVLEQLREQQGRIQALQEEKAGAKKENQDLRDENEVLRRELSRLQRISPGSAPSAAPSPAPAEGELLFGNPYSAAGGKLGAGAEPSLRKCPICEEVFPEDLPMGDLEEHIQSHLLECPICSESFDGASPQVFRDHIFCHSLE